ncbi:N-formylglutamate amidohydrolase [Celeribacter arenosi]|uniref:N-formylglutamate amidohydrolase n=1 Tax=Celeribacter arenosi TaxID=792649 RepID=A0ABP7JWL5_9RHOB
MDNAPFTLSTPVDWTSPVVFSSPHSGARYPDMFVRRSVLSATVLRSSEDAHVDALFDAVPQFGAHLLSAVFPRAWVDLNRRQDEFDPALIEGAPRGVLNPRVASGLGVIPRVVSGGRAIYRGKISRQEAQSRIEAVWRPYHARLDALLGQTRVRFGEAILVDCHSMPREAVANVRTKSGRRPEIVVGDRYGASAANEYVTQIEVAFRRQGFEVARNTPFAGAYIAQHYGRPMDGQHAVQVEIDRALYMNEVTLERSVHFNAVAEAISAAAMEIADIGQQKRALAAE